MPTYRRHPINKRITYRAPEPTPAEVTAALERFAAAQFDMAAAVQDMARRIGLVLEEWQQRLLPVLYPTRADLTLTK